MSFDKWYILRWNTTQAIDKTFQSPQTFSSYSFPVKPHWTKFYCHPLFLPILEATYHMHLISGFFCSILCFWDSFMLLHISLAHSSFLLTNTFIEYNRICSSIFPRYLDCFWVFSDHSYTSLFVDVCFHITWLNI